MLDTDPARRFSIRPSRPDVAADRTRNKATARKIRAARKLNHASTLATRKTAPRNLSPEEREELAGVFRKWWADHFADAAELLREDELLRLHDAARAFIFRELPREAWDEIRRAFEETLRAAQPTGYEPVRVKSWSNYARKDGW